MLRSVPGTRQTSGPLGQREAAPEGRADQPSMQRVATFQGSASVLHPSLHVLEQLLYAMHRSRTTKVSSIVTSRNGVASQSEVQWLA